MEFRFRELAFGWCRYDREAKETTAHPGCPFIVLRLD